LLYFAYFYCILIAHALDCVCLQHASETIGRFNVRSLLKHEEILPAVTLRFHVQPLRYFVAATKSHGVCVHSFTCIKLTAYKCAGSEVRIRDGS